MVGPFKDIHRVVPKTLLCYFGSLLKVIVLLQGEPLASLSSKVFFPKISLYLVTFIFPSTANSRPVPAAAKTPLQHDAATTMLNCWDCIGQVMSSA